MGSRIFAANVPGRSAGLVRRLEALGGLVMGLWLFVYVDSRFVPVVLLAWLALLLVRLAEVETDMNWAVIRRIMQRLHLGEFLNERNRVLRHTELTTDQANILKKLRINPPKPFVKLETTA